jgi:acyl-CoA thioesterase-1
MKFIWFCAAGYSFFIGIVLLIISIALSIFTKKNNIRFVVYSFVGPGAFLIFLSATPLPILLHIIWIFSLLGWLFCFITKKIKIKRIFEIFSICALLLSITAILSELRFQFIHELPHEKYEKLYVIGDSVSAGIGGSNEQTWPKILKQEHGMHIIDLAEPGATVATAMKQANQVGDERSVILLEIGGNDLFVPTPNYQFEKNLRELLKKTKGTENLIVMLELPLQPWQIRFGRIQRKLAKEFNVILIPKRFFVSILSAEGANLDLAHLSEEGHMLMAAKVRELLKDCLYTQDLP